MKSKVYFTKSITPESLIKIYEALGVELTGQVGVKVSTGEDGAKGYLKKKVSKEDGRSTNVYLTEKTKEMTDNILVDVSDYTWPFFESINDTQFEQVYNALKLLLEVTSE